VPIATRPIKLATVFIGICTEASSEIVSGFFIDMKGTHQNQNLIQLMPPLYNPDYRIDLVRLLVEILYHIVYIASSLYPLNNQSTYFCHQDFFLGSSFITEGLHVQLSQIQDSHLFVDTLYPFP
jgi:hypothetical protein